MQIDINQYLSKFTNSQTEYKNFRDELISRLTDGINKSRIGTKYKPVTKRTIAIKCNKNPFLKSDGELELLIKECESKGSYSKFWWVIK